MTSIKSATLLALMIIFSLTAFAGSNVPVDANSGEVIYKQTFKLNTNLSDEAIYELAQNWFTEGAEKFTRENEPVPVESNQLKNKQAVDVAFDNSTPLQSIDPESKRIAARGLVKYAGSNTSFIHLLYIEYYIVLEVKNHELTATISKLKYHHINRKTYAPMAIYNWSNSRPCDAADTFEHLVSNQNNTDEIGRLCTFLNDDVQTLFGDLRGLLKEKNALSSSES